MTALVKASNEVVDGPDEIFGLQKINHCRCERVVWLSYRVSSSLMITKTIVGGQDDSEEAACAAGKYKVSVSNEQELMPYTNILEICKVCD
jgi:hypothetical protein